MAEIKAISGNPEPPDFYNTIEALESSGELIGKITPVLFNLNSAETSKELQAVAREISPLLTRFSNDITLNKKLFQRISMVYEGRENIGLTPEQLMLTEKKYRNFILGGAGLSLKKKKRFREISEELATLSLKFDENVLEETNSFELHLTRKSDLAGLPGNLIEMAGMEASSRNRKGWIFTLHYPSYIPFMQYSERRELREKMLKAYSSRCYRGNEYDNRELVIKMVNLRLDLANILGFKTFADLALVDRMAGSYEKAGHFLQELFEASQPAAARDFESLSDFASRCGHKGSLERWDWSYYSEKLKKERFDINDEVLRPYFMLDNTEKAIFELAGTLYGIRFIRNSSIPVYNPEVRTFEVYDSDDSLLAVLYLDYHPRPGKSGGAWMTSFREQHMKDGADIRPLISIVSNFTRPSETRPSLLSFSELTTLLHEFGHALHGMLSRCTYESLSGTSVARDFVELPSQFMENFAYEKGWLDTWASHYVSRRENTGGCHCQDKGGLHLQ